jgi:hypothetical protein
MGNKAVPFKRDSLLMRKIRNRPDSATLPGVSDSVLQIVIESVLFRMVYEPAEKIKGNKAKTQIGARQAYNPQPRRTIVF